MDDKFNNVTINNIDNNLNPEININNLNDKRLD